MASSLSLFLPRIQLSVSMLAKVKQYFHVYVFEYLLNHNDHAVLNVLTTLFN